MYNGKKKVILLNKIYVIVIARSPGIYGSKPSEYEGAVFFFIPQVRSGPIRWDIVLGGIYQYLIYRNILLILHSFAVTLPNIKVYPIMAGNKRSCIC